VGVLLATEPWASNENQLIMDIGTNGEIVLATQGRLLACSVATGPAFEGAHIRFGMRAAAGAIESIAIHPDLTVEWKSISSEKPKGMCGSGIISGVAGLFARGIVNRTGKLNGAISASRLRKGKEGFEFVIAWAPETAINQDIVIAQKDIENIQMAKAALYAGAKILMKRAAVKKLIGFCWPGLWQLYRSPGSLPDRHVPDCNLDSVSMLGNAAGEGAVIALLNRDARVRAAELQSQVEYVELTLDPFFEHEFAMAMMLPHQKDTFSVL